MDPQGIIEMLLVFLEERTDGKLFHRPLNSNSVSVSCSIGLSKVMDLISLFVSTFFGLFCVELTIVWSQDEENRLLPFLGDWKGHSRTKRSGVYGATIAEADSFSSLQMDDNGQIIQV